MAGSKKDSDTRRGSSRRANDRREDADRREKDERRESDSRRNSDAPKPKAKSTRARTAAKDKVTNSGASGLQKFLKKAALAFSIVLLLVTGVLVYFFSHLDFYMDKVSKKVVIEMTKASIDPASLTDRTTKARLYFKVRNQLPFSIIFQNLKMNVKLSGYTIAKGMQIIHKQAIKENSESIVSVQFHVNSIMTRRGLQKAVERNAGPLLKSFLDRLQGKKDAITDNLKGVMKVEGSAEFRLVVGGVEIPFAKIINFDQGA